jgi:endoglucanase
VFKHISLSILLLFILIQGVTEANTIVLNQVGYLPTWPKMAFLVNADGKVKQAELLDAGDRHSVFKFKAGVNKKDPQTQDTLQELNFSEFNKVGRYIVKAGDVESHPFAIGQDIYQQPLQLLFRSYYLQRCGVKIDDTPTKLRHEACHLHDAVIAREDNAHKTGDHVPTTGGWHDAGDYGKYIATTAVTIGRLLALYEDYPDFFGKFSSDIPESGNTQPDILDEAQVGLDWMLAMQRPDGALYRKIGGDSWPKGLTPDQNNQVRFLYPITTPETAKAAAAWAMAARIYQKAQPEKAAKYLEAAKLSWHYLEAIDKQFFDYKEGDNKGSGPYMYNKTDNDLSLTYDWDDRLWAATELLIATGDEKYKLYVDKTLPTAPLNPFEWKDPSAMAMTHILFHPKLQAYKQWHTSSKKKLLDRAKKLMGNLANSGYRIANNRFVWSSNKITAEEGIILIYAYNLTKNKDYLNAATAQLNYLLGRNHFDLSFVSGVGTHYVENVSHIYLMTTKSKLPGLFVGGPNELEQSGIGPKNKGPLSYIDDARSYATNEYAIDYNASFIGLMGMLLNTPFPNKH